jgi:hypothetical protein
MSWTTDSCAGLFWALETFLTGLAAYRLAGRLCPGDDVWQRVGDIDWYSTKRVLVVSCNSGCRYSAWKIAGFGVMAEWEASLGALDVRPLSDRRFGG